MEDVLDNGLVPCPLLVASSHINSPMDHPTVRTRATSRHCLKTTREHGPWFRSSGSKTSSGHYCQNLVLYHRFCKHGNTNSHSLAQDQNLDLERSLMEQADPPCRPLVIVPLNSNQRIIHQQFPCSKENLARSKKGKSMQKHMKRGTPQSSPT